MIEEAQNYICQIMTEDLMIKVQLIAYLLIFIICLYIHFFMDTPKKNKKNQNNEYL